MLFAIHLLQKYVFCDIVNYLFIKLLKGRGKMSGNKQNSFQSFLEKVQDSEYRLLGIVKQKNDLFVFVPCIDSKKVIILTQDENAKNALDNRVSCKIKIDEQNQLSADIERVFGLVNDPISENIAIADHYGFSLKYPQQVLDEVSQIPQYVTPKDMENRLDLTDKYFMPWDDISCKDKDDAIYAEKLGNGYRVYVAIADVSHYVKPNSSLDREALKRGNSCYLGSGVYPMLPPELSNGICSLNEGVNRLALVAIMDIDSKGNLKSYDFKKSVINIKKSISYDLAESIHFNYDSKNIDHVNSKKYVDLMYEISDILEQKLDRRNHISLTNNQPLFTFNSKNGSVEDVQVSCAEKSHKVVEQFMILANEATAKFFCDKHLDGIYRVHQKPTLQNVDKLNDFLQNFGIKTFVDETNTSYARLLLGIQNHPAKAYLETAILKSLKLAQYSSKNFGHFGLGSLGYTHFTSPIRRYADLVAHRIISDYLEHGNSQLKSDDIQKICLKINKQERKANDAEAECNKYLACLWAEKHKGETKQGTIIYLNKNSVQVRYNTLDFVAKFDSLDVKKYGKTCIIFVNGKKLALGDNVDFLVSKTNLNSRTIYAEIDEVNTNQDVDSMTM